MHHHLAYNKENKTETDPRPRFKPTVKKNLNSAIQRTILQLKLRYSYPRFARIFVAKKMKCHL